MKIKTHLHNLQVKHDQLDTDVRKFASVAFVNDIELQDMKKRKLRIKEEIERLKADTPRRQ